MTENFDSVRQPVRAPERRPGPFPYFGASGVIDHVDDYLLDGEYLLVAEDGENLRTRKTPIAFLTSGKFWVNNHAHVIRGDGKSDIRFLSYFFAATDVSGYVSGSTQPKLTQQSLGNIRLRIPPIGTQRQISSTLGALDDKIELNHRMHRRLEETARAIFESWFVDFDPVHGTATVPGDVRRLFPDRLVDSQIGPIPEGWQVTPLGEQVEVTRGLSYTGAGLADEGMPLHNLNSILEGGGYKYDGIKYYTGEFRERDRARPGDVIVANTEQGFEHLLIGYPAIVPRLSGEDGLYSQDLSRLRPADGSPFTLLYIYLLLVGFRIHHTVAGYSNGTTVNHLAPDGLRKPLVVAPPVELVARFDEVVRPMFDQQEALTAESKALAELRDTLLPKLVSGDLRVPSSSSVDATSGIPAR